MNTTLRLFSSAGKVALALCIATLVSSPAVALASPAVPKGPNVLFILVDDLRPIGTEFGGPVSTPNLEALAKQGFRFTKNYANVPVCGASRASMLGGLAPSPSRFISYNSRLDADVPGAESLPGYFKRHGWTVLGNGKIFDVIDDSADSWSEPVWNPGMRWHSSTPEDERGEHLQKSYINSLPGGRPPTWERLDVDDMAYPDGEITARSIKDIQRLAREDQAFFLAVGFRKPHLPFNAPAKYWSDEVADSELLPETWRQVSEHLPSYATHRSLELRMQYNALPLLGEESDATAKELVRAYYAAARYIDAQIGQLTAALNESGVADQTIIVVAGDHGFFLGEQHMWTKHALFETALRTPLIIVDPRREGGHAVNAVVDLLDIFPTLAELANLPVPPHLDGRSLTTLLDAPTLSTHPDKPVSVSRWLNGESVRDAQYRYTAWYDESGNLLNQMMFDLVNDPLETHNIVDLPIADPLVAKLRDELAKRQTNNKWSPELVTLVNRMKFANSQFAPMILAVAAEPIRALYALIPIMLLLVGIVVLWRRRSRSRDIGAWNIRDH